MVNLLNLDPGAMTALEELILTGLAAEWESARRMLDPRVAQQLKRPLFALRDGETQWGTWSGERREISLSRKLAFGYGWDAVREVLFHEMAHQLAAEVFRVLDEPAHGPVFRKACGLLGANPAASGDYSPLSDRLEDALREPRDPHLRRVQKLLALAGSANRHEAEAAMIKAHHLIARHAIEAVGSQAPREFLSIFVGRPALRHSRFDYLLAALLQDFYFVLPMWVPAFVMERRKMGRVLEISGTPRNIRTAAYAAGLIRRAVCEEWAQRYHEAHKRRWPALDFAVGVLQGFRSRLEAGMADGAAAADAFSLVRKGDPQLAAYCRRRYPHTVGVYRSAPRQDRRLLAAGREIGKRLVLSEPLVQIGPGGGRLPPA
jgi:hypothetical protein